MTEKDYELIDLAMSTTYRDTIESYINQADTEECKEILRNIINDNITTFEE